MSYADSVIVLNKDGRVDRQGTCDELGIQYHHDDSEMHGDFEDPVLNSFECEQFESLGPSDLKKAPDKGNDDSIKTARQTGDVSVYGYYFASMKWTVAFAFVLFQIVFAFLATFPCTCPVQLTRSENERELTSCSCLAEMVDGHK